MVFERLQVSKATVFVYEGVLVIIPAVLSGVADSISDKACLRNEFYVNLYPLTGIIHFFIWFWDILRVWQLHCHLPTFPEKTVQTGDGSFVSALPELDPEHHQTGVGISAAHVVYEFDFLRSVLIWVAVRAM